MSGAILSWIQEHFVASGLSFLTVLLSLVQIAPIKVNPWSAIGKWLSHVFTQEVKDVVKEECTEIKKEVATQNDIIDTIEYKLNSIEEQIQSVQDRNDRDQLFMLRNVIIDCAQNLRDGRRYPDGKYATMESVYQRYEELCEKCEIENGVVSADMELIRAVRKELDKKVVAEITK